MTRNDFHQQIESLTHQHVEVLERSSDVMEGLTVFRGTRVPARTLFDYLAAGDPSGTFLDDFPSVRRDQAISLLELVRELLPT